MNNTLFAERVNAISNMISNLTIDPAERYGLAVAIAEIYRNELSKNLVVIQTTNGGQNAAANPNTNAAASGNT